EQVKIQINQAKNKEKRKIVYEEDKIEREGKAQARNFTIERSKWYEQTEINKKEDIANSYEKREQYDKKESLQKKEGEEANKKRKTKKSNRYISNMKSQEDDNMLIAYVVQLIHRLEEK
ncbi:1267_t:CDS:2, partial [Scutellospora calospora]